MDKQDLLHKIKTGIISKFNEENKEGAEEHFTPLQMN